MATTEYETHLTLAPTRGSDLERLGAWAAERRLKFTHIQLDRGRTPSQPMVTRWGWGGSPEDESARAAALSAELAAAGWTVVRVKTEVPADDPLAPATDAAAAGAPADRYFEAHVKLLLPPATTDLSAVAGLCARHRAHLSRNARRQHGDGADERFVTRRGFGVGRPSAERALVMLLTVLRVAQLDVLEVEQEYVVHDSNLSVDAGWM